MPRPALAAALLAALLLAPRPARACNECGAGDPTLTTLGEEVPDALRVRAGALLRVWGQRDPLADAHHASELTEARLDVSASLAVRRWLVVGLTVPLQARQVLEAHAAPVRLLTPGDLDLGVRVVAWRDRALRPRHVLSAVAGLELPTAPARRDAEGDVLPFHDQVTSGSVDPRLGVTYSLFPGAGWSGQASATVTVPTRGWDAYRMGPSARVGAAAQYQAVRWLGLRLGAEARGETRGVQAGVALPGTGGAVVYAVPALLASPAAGLALLAQVHVPLGAWGSARGEWPTAALGAVLDL